MHAMEGAFKVFLQGIERDVECVFTGDQHIVLTRPGSGSGNGRHGGLETAANAIAFDGAAHGFGDREAEARRRARGGRFQTRLCFQNEGGRWAPGPAPNTQEFRSLFEGGQFHVRPSEQQQRVIRNHPQSTRPTGACGPWRDGGPEPAPHQGFPCACGSHAGACAQACSVDRCASRYSPSDRYPR